MFPNSHSRLALTDLFCIKARNTLFFVLLTFSLNIHAMSQTPDIEVETLKSSTDSIAGETLKKSNKALQLNNPEEDVLIALSKNDFRLLGFATRSTSIPGIEAIDKMAYMEKCGVRLMKGFGDVSRSEQQTQLMHQTYEYAAKYNQLIIDSCLAQ